MPASAVLSIRSVVVVGTAHILVSGAFGRGIGRRLGRQRTGVEPVA